MMHGQQNIKFNTFISSLDKPPVSGTEFYLGGRAVSGFIPRSHDTPDWNPHPLQYNSNDIFLSQRKRI
jgi:hypothetical protein